MHLTKTVVDKLSPPVGRDQAFYRDDQLKGFAVRVMASGVKSFVVEKLIKGKVKRITLGRYGELTVEQARKQAHQLLGKIATGIDPLAERRAASLKSMTLNEVFQDYLKARKELKPKTVYDYRQLMTSALGMWQSKPFLSITKDKIAKHHTELGEQRGKAYSNSAMRLLRALFNFAAGQYEDSQGCSLVTENPVKRLSKTRAWYRVKPRQTYITPYDFPAWHQGVLQIENQTLKDYLLVVLFTGLRRNEAAQLKWADVDLKNKTLSIADPKNHKAHTLPLSDYLHQLLISRQQVASSDYVFPGTGKGGYLIEPRKQMAKVIEHSGVSFTVHDLRRTFITVAESLDISAYAVKRLVNHKINNDVTAGYIVTDVERLRKPMQMITDHFLKLVSHSG
jgi:integrase